jgi:hypothetical protein
LVKSVEAAVADLLNIYRTRTVSFHPMGNGAAERAVRNSIKVISAIIAGEVNSDLLEWDISCPKAALAINTSPSTSTLQMPWLVKHSSCSEAILPVSIMAEDLSSVQDVDVVVRDLQEHQKRMFQSVSRATGVAQQHQKGYYDLKVKGLEISVGDLVVYEDKTNLRAGEICSLRLPYKMPLFQVARKLSDVNYEITPGPHKDCALQSVEKGTGTRPHSGGSSHKGRRATASQVVSGAPAPRAPGRGHPRPGHAVDSVNSGV